MSLKYYCNHFITFRQLNFFQWVVNILIEFYLLIWYWQPSKVLNKDDIFKGTWYLHNDQDSWLLTDGEATPGTNSSVHFPAIIGVDIQGRVQSATENTD